jgi:hypothetical protein
MQEREEKEMKIEDKIGSPLVPVPWEHLGEVRALLERLAAQDGASVDGTEESRAELVRRVFDRCSKPTQRLLLHLAKDGGWVYGEELAEAADPRGTTNVSPYMRSMNSAIKRYQLEPGLLEYYRDADRLFLFKMRDQDAEIVRRFAG